MIAMHGLLLDSRLQNLRRTRDIRTLIRLLARRDLTRLVRLPAVRWVGVEEFVRILDARNTTPVAT
jgi:hypothetical protein